jgi:aspartate/methionine/tyrosine aminotransferase
MLVPSVQLRQHALLVVLGAALVGFLFGREVGSQSSLRQQQLDGSATARAQHVVDDVLNNPRHTVFDELTAAETRAVAAYVVAHMPGVKTSMFPDGGSEGGQAGCPLPHLP